MNMYINKNNYYIINHSTNNCLPRTVPCCKIMNISQSCFVGLFNEQWYTVCP